MEEISVETTNVKIDYPESDTEFTSLEMQSPAISENIPLVTDFDNEEHFFSNLMPDWFDPKQKNYDLARKVNRENFSKLLDIAERKIYATVSLRIIYQYFYECDIRIDDCFSLNEICDFDTVFKLKNESFKYDLLKLIVAHWDTENFPKGYKVAKEIILNNANETNQTFFKMAFMLHESLVNKFEIELEKHIVDLKEKFGDFHESLIEPDLPLLLVIMKRQKMYKTIDFLFKVCPYMKYNSTILAVFQKIQEHQRFIVDTFDDQGYAAKMNDFGFIQETLKNHENLLPEHQEIFKTLMLGWKIKNGCYQDNFLEKILMQSDNKFLINLVWKKFKLWQKGFILNMQNPAGKRLIDYIDPTFDQENFTTFLMPRFSQEPTFKKRKFFLMLLNRQFFEIKGKTLYEFYIESELQGEEVDFMIIFYLLEEKGIFEDVLNEESVPFEKLKNLAVNGELEKLEDENFIDSRLFKVDDLLCNIIAYCNWPINDEKYEKTKSELIAIGIVYEMLFMIVENRDENEFLDNMKKFKEEICDFIDRRYQSLERNSSYTTNFMLVYLIAAMKHNKRKIIEMILKAENFNNLKLQFPENIGTGSIYNFVALKMLQNGHHLGKNNIPQSWITPNVMNEFLDSQIVYHGHELIKVDCSFMLHPNTRKTVVETAADVDNSLIFDEDTETLKFLMENKNVEPSVCHPVVSTYINLKSKKFSGIYYWNLWAFLLLFVLPFSGLILNRFVCNKVDPENMTENNSHDFIEIIFMLWCLIGFLFVASREIFQFWFMEETFKSYFRRLTNKLELFLIIFSLMILWLFIFKSSELSMKYSSFLSAWFLLAVAVEVLCLIPISSSQQYTMIIKNISSSFPKFFVFFGLMLVPFSFCFCIIFRSHTQGEFFENFQEFWTSLFKLLLMLSGEYSIEIVKLNVFEMIFVSFFVLTTFWLFALIIGFSVSDVKELRDDARRKILEENAKKILHARKFFFKIYREFGLDKHNDSIKLSKHRNFFLDIFKSLLAKHIFIQKIDKVYINVKTREISVKFIERHEKILKGNSYYIDEIDFDLVRDIVNRRFDSTKKEKED